MNTREIFSAQVFSTGVTDFERLCLEMFRWQAAENPVYAQYCEGLGVIPSGVGRLEEIPFLPVELFKSLEIKTGAYDPVRVFLSSTTGSSTPSRHLLREERLYEESFTRGFTRQYGDPASWLLLALLPSYLEREGSSLVFMTEKLIRAAALGSGFYLSHQGKLRSVLQQAAAAKQKTMLLGVIFALLDFAAAAPVCFPELVVMETGGMKGRRRELLRSELHSILEAAFMVPAIHSEYGMTELLSQAYAPRNGLFECPPWMKALWRDPTDPKEVKQLGTNGALNLIDLANIDSCAFLATSDLGHVYPDGRFEVLGRMDRSEWRGCNLMVS